MILIINNSIKAMESKEFRNCDNEFLEYFKKINYNNTEKILQNIRYIIDNIKKDLKLIINTMNNECTSYIALSDSHKKSIDYIIEFTEEIDYMINNILKNTIPYFHFNLQFKGNHFNYMQDLKKLYKEITNIFKSSFKNQKIISSYLYEQEYGIQVKNLKKSNNLKFEEKILLLYIEKSIIEDIKEFKYLNQESCSEMINKLVIMLNTYNIVELLINFRSENNILEINELICNIINFQARVLEYQYPIESQINFSLEIPKYKNITLEIENSILASLDFIVNNLANPKEIKIIKQYKEFFTDIVEDIKTPEFSQENSNIEKISLKEYIDQKKDIFLSNFLSAV